MDWSFKPADMSDGEWISLNWQCRFPEITEPELREEMKRVMRDVQSGRVDLPSGRLQIYEFIANQGITVNGDPREVIFNAFNREEAEIMEMYRKHCDAEFEKWPEWQKDLLGSALAKRRQQHRADKEISQDLPKGSLSEAREAHEEREN